MLFIEIEHTNTTEYKNTNKANRKYSRRNIYRRKINVQLHRLLKFNTRSTLCLMLQISAVLCIQRVIHFSFCLVKIKLIAIKGMLTIGIGLKKCRGT